ncbi:hypothetical protein HDU97_010398 [Phlyctochytrium planicorne]|nr:hypothetical protein HDU97_010398 [Phlyctochytrium planicorne]
MTHKSAIFIKSPQTKLPLSKTTWPPSSGQNVNPLLGILQDLSEAPLSEPSFVPVERSILSSSWLVRLLESLKSRRFSTLILFSGWILIGRRIAEQKESGRRGERSEQQKGLELSEASWYSITSEAKGHSVSYRQGSDHGHIVTLWEDRLGMPAHNPYASTSSPTPATSAGFFNASTGSPSQAYYAPVTSANGYPTTSASTPTMASSLLSSPNGLVFPQKTRVVMRTPDGVDLQQQQMFVGAGSTSPSMQRLRGSNQQQMRSIVVN